MPNKKKMFSIFIYSKHNSMKFKIIQYFFEIEFVLREIFKFKREHLLLKIYKLNNIK